MANEFLDAQLQAFVGKGGDRFTAARDKVTPEGIRKLTDTVGDRNPVYSDPEFAAKSVHGAQVAPPASVMVFWQRGFEPVPSSDWVDAEGVRHFRLDPLPIRGAASGGDDFFLDVVPGVLSKAGYTSLAGVGGEIKLLRYPRVGEQLFYSDSKIGSIKGPKQLSVGEGYFTVGTVFVKNQDGELIAEMSNTRMDFAPAAPVAKPAASSDKAQPAKAAPSLPALRPSTGVATQVTLNDDAAGQELPSMIVEVTPSLIIAGALLGGDPMDVHHDQEGVRRRGFKDVFMNTMTTQGLITRFVSDWAGPEAVVEHISWRLGAQQYPGDNLYLTGKVASVEPGDQGSRAMVEVLGTNRLGMHVSSTLRVLLPAGR